MYAHSPAATPQDASLARLAELGRAFLREAVMLVAKAAYAVLDWQERVRQRHMLASLDERMLKDMGLSRGDVARETAKPFWMG